jgi:hypothetical protein
MQYLAGIRPDASGRFSGQQSGDPGKSTGTSPGINPAAWSAEELRRYQAALDMINSGN